MRTETFSTPEPPLIRIIVPSGDVRVETTDAAETTVEVEGPLEDDAKIERHRNEIVIEVGKKRIFGGNSDHTVRVRAPHASALDANVASADVEGRGRFAGVEVNSASGDVRVEKVDGRLKVNTASGDVEVEQVVGEVKVNSASGDVTIGETEGDTKIRTASGDVQIRSAVSGKIDTNSASGDVEVGIRRGSSVFIDASSMSGDMTSELDVSDAPPVSGGPKIDFRARTMSGDVKVRRG
jgi:DUF4097 and DUF4098 domain-containing protein YvlB